MLWWFDSTRPHLASFDQGDVAQPGEHLACNEEDVGSTPTVSTLFASVVSTASTRPLYGRGVGSNPAGGSSSYADVAQTEEQLSQVELGATPGRPVRSGSPALEGLWCKRQHGELQPRWSGFDPWQACFTHDRRGPERLGYLVRAVAHPCAVAVRLRVPTASHDRDVLPCCGPDGSGYRLLIDRSRVRVPLGALVLR